jgi:transposase
MSYEYLMLREEELVSQIDELIEQAEQSHQAEDGQYQGKTGYEIPEELKIKEKRLAKIRAAKEALEKREKGTRTGQKVLFRARNYSP